MKLEYLILTIFFIIPTIVLADEPITNTVRLPSITHTWASGEKESVQEITIEEVDKCISKDLKIREKYQQFKEEASQLENEAKSFDPITKSLAIESEALDHQAKLLNDKTVLLNNRTAALDKQNLDIKASRVKKMDVGTANKLNTKIDLYNNEVKSHNADLSLLRVEVSQFENNRDRFNAVQVPIKTKLEAFNNKASAFKSRKQEFDNLIMSFKDKCEGERSLIK